MTLGFVRLESPLGILRDGLPLGARAPRWTIRDDRGRLRKVPSGESWQLLVFGDHSLEAFPDLVSGIKRLTEDEPSLEVLVLHSAHPAEAEMTAEALRLLETDLPLVKADDRLRSSYNVRVLPFLIFLDAAGRARGRGLVNSDAAVQALWREAYASRLANDRRTARRGTR